MGKLIFSVLLNRAHWEDSVIELSYPDVCVSVCLSVCLSVCANGCSFFQGLSLDLISQDQFQASHWSSHPPSLQNNMFLFLADSGEARGCSTNTSITDSFLRSWFVKIYLRRRHALIVADGAFSHTIDYVY